MRLSRQRLTAGNLLAIILMVLLGIAPLWPIFTTQAAGTKNVWFNWIVSNGIFEAGGHVVANGFPLAVRSGQTYLLNFTFYVDAFDWGSSIRPRSVEWLGRINCLERSQFACARNSQNLTLGSSLIDGNYSLGQQFTVVTRWSFVGRPTSNNTQAFLGMRMPAVVECWDSSKCLPPGETRFMTKSFVNPEVGLTLLVSQDGFAALLSWGTLGFWAGLAATGALASLGIAVVRRSKRKLISSG